MIYRKWDKTQKRFVRKRYEIIPIDCGVSSAGNPVLYAEDYRDNKQIKMFIIKQIEKF
jgi:adenine specific DNA methylase Mod